MRYRIAKVTNVDSPPVFTIVKQVIRSEGFLIQTKKEYWNKVDKEGYAITSRYGRPSLYDPLSPFKTLKIAKEYLEKIIIYQKGQKYEIVFDTQQT